MPNRNKVQKYFITFPQTNVQKSEILDILLIMYPTDIVYFKCSQETHEDGGKHLHFLIIFKKGVAKHNMIKFFRDTYPDDYKRIKIEVIRSVIHSVKYLDKEDKDPLMYGVMPLSRKLRIQAEQLYVRLDNSVPGCPCEYFSMQINCPICGAKQDVNVKLKCFK